MTTAAATRFRITAGADRSARAGAVAALMLSALALAPLAAQSAPGTTRWGANQYVEYVVGNLPVLISAPHGGDLEPPTIPDRTYGTTVKDTRTIELTREFADRLTARFGMRPHMVVCHLARTKLDANREIVEAAQGNPVAEQAWNDFHQACADARQAILAQWGHGIYIDLHGHGHPEGWVELGYALSSSQLNLPNSTLNAPLYVNQSTIRSAASLPGVVFTDLLRGTSSLGAALELGGFASVPSPTNPGPGTWLANNPVVVSGPVLLGPGTGGSWTWQVPSGAAGLSLMLQSVALWSAAPNGVYAASDAHEIRLR